MRTRLRPLRTAALSSRPTSHARTAPQRCTHICRPKLLARFAVLLAEPHIALRNVRALSPTRLGDVVVRMLSQIILAMGTTAAQGVQEKSGRAELAQTSVATVVKTGATISSCAERIVEQPALLDRHLLTRVGESAGATPCPNSGADHTTPSATVTTAKTPFAFIRHDPPCFGILPPPPARLVESLAGAGYSSRIGRAPREVLRSTCRSRARSQRRSEPWRDIAQTVSE